MINIEMDGVYCPKCKTLHPKLFWHEKFNDYFMPFMEYERLKTVFTRFGVEISDEECKQQYMERALAIGISFVECVEQCVLCNVTTNFIEVDSGHFVCSEECLDNIRKLRVVT